jgi:hypothetical protein
MFCLRTKDKKYRRSDGYMTHDPCHAKWHEAYVSAAQLNGRIPPGCSVVSSLDVIKELQDELNEIKSRDMPTEGMSETVEEYHND